MVTKSEPVLWKPLIWSSVAGLLGVFILTPVSRQWSIILLLGLLGVWTRIPGYYIPQIKELQTIDFFALMIALAYGPWYGAGYAIIATLWSRVYGPQEGPTVAPKLGVNTAFSCFIAYYLFPIIPDFGTLLTFLIIFEYTSYLFLTFIFERDAMAIEIYYSIILLPITYLHRLIVALLGADYLFELMAHESGSLIWIYLLGVGIIAGIVGMYWANQKYDFSNRFSLGKLFGENRENALKALIRRTGFDFGEAKDIIYAVLVLGFILSAGQWGGETFSLGAGLINLFIAINVVFLSYVLHNVAYKWYARQYGAYGKYKFFSPIAIFALLVGIVSEGKIIIPVLGGIALMTPHFFRPGRVVNTTTTPFLGPKDRSRIMAVGPVVSTFLALFAGALMSKFGESTLLSDLFRFNVWLAAASMLPLAFPVQAKYREIQSKFMPPFPGAIILHGSRNLYTFLLLFIFASLALINYVGLFLSIILGIILALLLWMYFLHKEFI